jgi:hypothetical protein
MNKYFAPTKKVPATKKAYEQRMNMAKSAARIKLRKLVKANKL